MVMKLFLLRSTSRMIPISYVFVSTEISMIETITNRITITSKLRPMNITWYE